MNTALGLLAVLLLTLATGYFVAQEFAFVAADRGVLREQADAGDAAAKRALEVTGRLSFMLSGAQLGITVTALLVGFISEPAIATVIRPWLQAAGVPESAVPGIAVALAVAIATVVQMVLGELAPKNLGIARPEPVAKFLSGSTLVYLKIAGPVIRLFDSAATGLLRLVGVEPVEEIEHGASPEELSRIISESATAGDLPPGLSELLERALEFGDRTAEDVMVPRPRVVLLRDERPISDLLDAVREHGHSRYPVLCNENGDDVVGVTGVRELLRVRPVRRPAGEDHPPRAPGSDLPAAAGRAGAHALRRRRHGLRHRRVRRPGRCGHHRGPRRGARGRAHGRERPGARGGRRGRATAPGTCRARCGSTRSSGPPSCRSPRATTTTPSPASCSPPSAGWPNPATRSPSP